MEQQKTRKNRFLLPLIVVAALIIAALVLALILQGGQKRETEREITLTAPPEALTALTVAQPPIDRDNPPYTVVERPAEPGRNTPPIDAMSADDAAYEAARLIAMLFNESFSGEAFYVQYDSWSAAPQYDVRIGGEEEFDYQCYVDGLTGEIRLIFRTPPYCVNPVEWGDPMEDDGWWGNYTPEIEQAAAAAARAFVEEKLADGRTVVTAPAGSGTLTDGSFIDGVQAVFGERGYTLALDYKARMSEGDCYLVRVSYPDFEIMELDYYPLGWHSCVFGYWDPAEEKAYPSFDGSWTWADANAYTDAQSPFEELTEEDCLRVAEAARARVGESVSLYGHEDNRSYTYSFVAACVKAAGFTEFSCGGGPLTKEAVAGLLPGAMLTIRPTGVAEDEGHRVLHALYVGDGKYVFANPETQTVVERDLAADWGVYFLDADEFVINGIRE